MNLKTHFEPQEGTVEVKQQMETYAGLTGGYNPKNITIIHTFSHIQTGYAFFEVSKRSDDKGNDQIVKVKYKKLEVSTYDGAPTGYHIGDLEVTVVGQYSYGAFDTDRRRLETFLCEQINVEISQLLENKAKITDDNFFEAGLTIFKDQCIQLISDGI